MAVTGEHSGRVWVEADISDAAKLAQMAEERLTDDSGAMVVPVPTPDGEHFRVLGGGRAMPVNEREPTINGSKAALRLARRFKDATHLRFSTRIHLERSAIFADDDPSMPTPVHEQAVLNLVDPSSYDWRQKKRARVRFPDHSRLELDLTGSHAARFRPSAASPDLVIEVVDGSWAGPERLARLRDLSRCACIVIFWFIDGDGHDAYFNACSEDRGLVTCRFAAALIDGECWINGVHVALSGVDVVAAFRVAALEVFEPLTAASR